MDSVQRLKQYADNNEITSSNWHFLTGNKADIYALARRSYFAEEELGFSKDSTDSYTQNMYWLIGTVISGVPTVEQFRWK